MEFAEGIDRATELAERVMSLISDRGIPPVPKIYTVLYAYLVDANPELTKETAAILADDNGDLVKSLSKLFDKFYGSLAAEEALEDAAREIEGKMGAVLDVLATASGDTKEFGENLQKNVVDLKAEPNNLSTILNTLVGQTETIIQKNATLQDRLEASVQEIDNLQENLGDARKEALIDGLTGIANRKCFDVAVKTAVESHNENQQPLCIAMTDIDHFKVFNDTHGHQTGDKVLKAVAQIINSGVRNEDIVARYGGEEFSLILPELGLKAAFDLCERLREAVSRKILRNRKTGKDMGRINISIGIAEYRAGETVFDVLKRADTCLYQAKSSGRNMTIPETLLSDATTDR